jgi:5-methylcytosine-specific restriction endonuclease McrA
LLATQDHIIPVSRGGGLTFENIQALCKSCNSSKNAKLDKSFITVWIAAPQGVVS